MAGWMNYKLLRKILYGRPYSEESDLCFHDREWEEWRYEHYERPHKPQFHYEPPKPTKSERWLGPCCEKCGRPFYDAAYPEHNCQAPKQLNGKDVCDTCYKEG